MSMMGFQNDGFPNICLDRWVGWVSIIQFLYGILEFDYFARPVSEYCILTICVIQNTKEAP